MKQKRMDRLMFAIAAGLAVFGTMMVFSASAMIAHRETGGASQFTYFYKQAGFAAAGIGIMYAVSLIDYRRWNNFYVVAGVLAATVLILLAVFAFPEINGARRWIRIGAFSFQPSEIAKFSLPLFLAYFLTRNEDRVWEFRATVVPCLAALALIGGLVFIEPDLGTTMVLCAIFASIYFAAGARLVHIAAVVAVLVVVGIGALLIAPWRLRRIGAFLDPCDPENAVDAGYQVCQSLYAIGSGGIFGEGFAKGQQKLFYLPYPHSDFIFSVVGEEFGLLGTFAIVIAFGLLLWRGARAALKAPDRFGTLLGIGLITGVTIQALFNLSVVISLLPAKGIPLPFISYGGTSVMVALFSVGILLGISRQADGRSTVAGKKAPVVRRKEKKGGFR